MKLLILIILKNRKVGTPTDGIHSTVLRPLSPFISYKYLEIVTAKL